MRLMFFVPGLRKSAIGRAANLVAQELLRQGHELTVVRCVEEVLFVEPAHDFSCPILPWTDFDRVAELSKAADLIVYHIGNNYPYHKGCLEWLPIAPGVVCLHDNFLGHLFWSYADATGREAANAIVSRLYGAPVSERFFHHNDGASFLAFAVECAPMTEWVSEMASGVIVHSSGAMNRLTMACSGPVEVVPLPYDAPVLNRGERAASDDFANEDRVFILTIGHVNPNKRHASVIEAIGASPVLREKAVFCAVGPATAEEAEKLQRLAERLNVKLLMTGEVDDLRLAELIGHADVMCCLRWPSLEAASASTIEAMLYGKPVVVTNTGFYRDLPDNCVIKISPERELFELREALENLVGDPAGARRRGLAAQLYAQAAFRADHYADRIVSMKSAIDQARHVAFVAEDIASTMKRWGASGEPSLIEPVAAPLEIFR